MAELHNTVIGKRLIEHTLPEIAKQLERIADVLESKSQPNPIASSLNSLAKFYTDDAELGKQIRKVCRQ